MVNMLGPSPGALRYPNHRIRISPSTMHWTVLQDKNRLADSRRTLVVDETGYGSVVYFPPDNVETHLLLESETRTTCPFKGEARYLCADVEGKVRDIAWYYPSVYDEVVAIAGYVAFDSTRIRLLSEHVNV